MKDLIQTFIYLSPEQSKRITAFKNAYNRRFQAKIKKREAYLMIIDLLSKEIDNQTTQWNKEYDNFVNNNDGKLIKKQPQI